MASESNNQPSKKMIPGTKMFSPQNDRSSNETDENLTPMADVPGIKTFEPTQGNDDPGDPWKNAVHPTQWPDSEEETDTMQQEAVEEKQEQHEQPEKKKEEKPQKEGKKSKKRKEVKEEKKEEEFKHKRKGFIRIFPVWLRVIVILALTVGALVAGLMVGYGVLGEGDDMNDVLDRQLWEGIYDYIRGE